MSAFKDETTISVFGGRGGDGCVSFRREAFVPKGGPDGGDGGRGGSVILKATRDVGSLMEFTRRRKIKAKNGIPGSGGNKSGPDGADEVLLMPLGTLVFDRESGVVAGRFIRRRRRPGTPPTAGKAAAVTRPSPPRPTRFRVSLSTADRAASATCAWS